MTSKGWRDYGSPQEWCMPCRVRRKPSHKIMYFFRRCIPVDTACVFKYFWRRNKLASGLRLRRNIAGLYFRHSVCHHIGSQFHKPVVNIPTLSSGLISIFRLLDYVAGVDFMLQKESRDTCFFIAIDNCPVDGGGSAIFWKK